MEAVGVVVLKAALGFLVGQAGDLLKRWVQRRDAGAQSAGQTEPVPVEIPDLFQGQLAPIEIHWSDAEKVVDRVREVWRRLVPYEQGVERVEGAEVTRDLDALRRLLEAAYQQRLTFKGEARPPSGPVVEGEIDAQVVDGEVAGIIASSVEPGGTYRGKARVRRVRKGGSAAGVIIGHTPDTDR